MRLAAERATLSNRPIIQKTARKSRRRENETFNDIYWQTVTLYCCEHVSSNDGSRLHSDDGETWAALPIGIQAEEMPIAAPHAPLCAPAGRQGWPGGHPALSSSSEPMLANPADEKTPPSSRLRRKLGGVFPRGGFFPW